MEKYASQKVVREVLLVWGPKSTGKTEGINLMCHKWRDQGRSIVRVDLKGFVGTTDTFMTSFYGQVLNALSTSEEEYRIPLETVQLLTRLAEGSTSEEDSRRFGYGNRPEEEALQVPPEKIRVLNDLATQLFCHFSEYYTKAGLFTSRSHASSSAAMPSGMGGVGSTKPAPAYRVLRDLLPNWRIGSQFYQIFTGPRVLPGLMIVLEMMAELTPNKTPIVILTEIQNLARNELGGEGHKLFETLFKSFEVRKQGGSRVPVITEMSEFLFSELQSSIQAAGESFEPLMVGLCPKKEVESVLVPTYLPQDKFEQLWASVGGHQGSIYAVFKCEL